MEAPGSSRDQFQAGALNPARSMLFWCRALSTVFTSRVAPPVARALRPLGLTLPPHRIEMAQPRGMGQLTGHDTPCSVPDPSRFQLKDVHRHRDRVYHQRGGARQELLVNVGLPTSGAKIEATRFANPVVALRHGLLLGQCQGVHGGYLAASSAGRAYSVQLGYKYSPFHAPPRPQ